MRLKKGVIKSSLKPGGYNMVLDIDLSNIIPEQQKIDPDNCIILFKGAGEKKESFNWTFKEF